jgi:hypothetical protein
MRRQLERDEALSDHPVRRIDPRALVRVRATAGVNRPRLGGFSRLVVVSLSAAAGLAAFGAIPVRANDDKSLPHLVRGEQRPAQPFAPAKRQGSQAYPITSYAPRGFFPSERPVAELRQNGYPVGGPQSLPVIQPLPGPRSGPLVAETGAYSGFLRIEPLTERVPRRSARSGFDERGATLTTPAFYPSNALGQSSAAACMRTCDGFNLLAGTESRSEPDNTADRANRTGYGPACGCFAGGSGTAAVPSVFSDATLRVGDIVMTRTGMKVFNGGSYPYGEANFTPIGQSDLIDAATRETLRKVEQASLPGKSGLFNQPPVTRNSALRDISAASRAAESPANIVRYIGPDRPNAR